MGFLAGIVNAINKAGPAPSGGQGNDGNDGNGVIAQLMREHPELAPRLKKGGKVSSASKRADGIAQRGKTRGKMY
jgi:hypothetical protein